MKTERQPKPKRVLLANGWWHIGIMTHIARRAAARRWHLDLQTCFSGNLPEEWDGDGMLTMLGPGVEAVLNLQQKCQCPLVSLAKPGPEVSLPTVTQDDVAVAQLAVDHFRERGFRYFAYYLGEPVMNTSSIRRDAFHRLLRDHGYRATDLLGPDAGKTQHTWQDRQAWLAATLQNMPRPVAVLAINDRAAVEVIEACLANAIAVPEEVAVLGVLDMPMFRHCTPISLSSIRMDLDKTIGAACDLLDQLMDGAPPPDKPILFPPWGISTRESTETIAASLPEVAKAIRFMFKHYREPIDISQIAQEAGVSRSVLYQRFDNDLGQSPHAILISIRLHRAKDLLEKSHLKISAVSEACGFGDPVNLHRTFKKHVGVSPAAYRNTPR